MIGELTIDDVCLAAGASKGSFYSHFANKRALFVALVDRQADLLDAAVDVAGRDVAGLRRFATSATTPANDPAFVQLRADVWAAASVDHALRRYLGERIEARRTALASIVEGLAVGGTLGDVQPRAVASLLLALTDGLALHCFASEGAFDWNGVHGALHHLLGGIASDSPAL